MISPEQIPLPEDFLIEEPNPYRRRQRVIGIRRGGNGRLIRITKYAGLGVVLPLALILGLRWAVRSVMASPLLVFQPVKDVRLTGNRVVALDDVLNAMGLGSAPESLAVNIFHINLGAMRRRVEAIPWVASAAVTRFFPDRLRVTIVERTPIAYANVGGRVKLVDKDGVFLDARQRKDPDFPVLYGLDASGGIDQRKVRLTPYEQFVAETKAVVDSSGWSISEADLSDPDDLRLLLVEGHTTVLAHFGDKDYQQRFKTFATVAPKVLANNPKIDSMDLRFHGEVVVDPVVNAPARSNPGQKNAGDSHD